MDINREEKIIFQHNAITSGRYDFSACQLDVLFMVLASLEKGKREYRIHAKDIELITGRKWNYQQFKASTEELGSRMFEIETDNTYTQLWLFSSIKYQKGEGCFDVKLNDDALPYFFELKNNFTSMQLKSVLDCSSKYAKRLYELACQWRVSGSKRFVISDLKDMLGLVDEKTGKETFEKISQFKERVLDVAKSQINENTDIYFDYELIKRGRSYYWIVLRFEPKKEIQLTIDFEKNIIDQVYLGNIKSYGIPHDMAEKIAERERKEDFEAIIQDLSNKVKSKKISISNSVGYLIGIYKNKGIL